MYIAGVGMTKFTISNKTTMDLAYEAAVEALEDSNINYDDIDAVVVSTVDTKYNLERQRHYNSLLASLFKRKMPIIRTTAVCGGGGLAFWQGLRMKYDNVLVLATDKVSVNNTKNITDVILQAADRIWEQTEGLIFPAQNALVAQQHMQKFGTTHDQLALIAHKNHCNAAINPKAHFYGKKIDLDTIKNAPVVASPFTLFDCSISVNGAAAAVITNKKTDIKVAGSGTCVDYLATFEREDMTTWRATLEAARQAYQQAGVTPKDVDVAEVHDAFTIVELIAYEDLGFCKKGEGGKFIESGKPLLDGELPVNTSGGIKAKGHPISPTGMAQIVEVVEQLRGKSGDRQVKDAKIGLTQNIGGAGGSITVNILKKVD